MQPPHDKEDPAPLAGGSRVPAISTIDGTDKPALTEPQDPACRDAASAYGSSVAVASDKKGPIVIAETIAMAPAGGKYGEPSRMGPYSLAGGLGTGPDVYALSDTVLRTALGVELHGKVQLVPQHHRLLEHPGAGASR